jgi:hypothetical protein
MNEERAHDRHPPHGHGHGHGHDHGRVQDNVKGPKPGTPTSVAAGHASLLMRGAGARVAAALVAIAALWLAVAWALLEVSP